MTHLLDRFMASVGFDIDELALIKHRSILYFGNLAMLAVSVIMLAVIVL